MENLKRNNVRSHIDRKKEFKKKKNRKSQKSIFTKIWNSIKEFFRSIFKRREAKKKKNERCSSERGYGERWESEKKNKVEKKKF